MRILCITDRFSAVYQYRMGRPLVEGMNAKVRKSIMRKNERLMIKDLAQRFKRIADVWVIKYIDHFHTLEVLYSMRNVAKAKIIVDIDDNIWQIPPGNVALGDMKSHINRCFSLTESVKAADWVTVSTEPLKNILLPLNSNIVVLPNYINPQDWKFKRKKHKKVRIGWVWSPTHIPDNAVVSEALKVISLNPKVEIVMFGTTKDVFDFPTTNIKGVPYTQYPQTFMEEGIDISIAPLADNEFNRCKSNIKWLESTMAGACFVGSKVYPYEFSVKHGKTGYLASNTNQWIKYLNYLIDHPERRKELVANAKKEVLEKYSNGNQWQLFYKSIL